MQSKNSMLKQLIPVEEENLSPRKAQAPSQDRKNYDSISAIPSRPEQASAGISLEICGLKFLISGDELSLLWVVQQGANVSLLLREIPLRSLREMHLAIVVSRRCTQG